MHMNHLAILGNLTAYVILTTIFEMMTILLPQCQVLNFFSAHLSTLNLNFGMK